MLAHPGPLASLAASTGSLGRHGLRPPSRPLRSARSVLPQSGGPATKRAASTGAGRRSRPAASVLYCRYAVQADLVSEWASLLASGGRGAGASGAGAAASRRRQPAKAASRPSVAPSTSSRWTPSSGTSATSSSPTSTKDEFEIYEDGVKQDIHVDDAGARRARAQPAGAAAAADAGGHHPAAVAAAQRRRRPHLPDHRRRPAPRLPQHRPHSRSVQAHLDRTWSTKATCSPSSRPVRRRIAIDPTYDRKILDDAIKKITRQRAEAVRHHPGRRKAPRARRKCATARTSRSRPPTTCCSRWSASPTAARRWSG